MNTLEMNQCEDGLHQAVRPWAAVLALTVAAWAPLAVAAPLEREFDTPDAAVAALVDAVRAHHIKQLRSILGPGGDKLVRSGDPAEDASSQQKFVLAYDTAHRIVYPQTAPDTAELQIGSAAWPLPIPLVKAASGRWHFNAASGAAEILARRIGQNELSAMQVCLAIMDAEHKTALPQGLVHTTGGKRVPYQGYFYKRLAIRGDSAAGAASDAGHHDGQTSGLAVLAYPARYGASGVMSFVVTQNRILYERNLGRATASIARGLQVFHAEAPWHAVQPVPGS